MTTKAEPRDEVCCRCNGRLCDADGLPCWLCNGIGMLPPRPKLRLVISSVTPNDSYAREPT